MAENAALGLSIHEPACHTAADEAKDHAAAAADDDDYDVGSWWWKILIFRRCRLRCWPTVII